MAQKNILREKTNIKKASTRISHIVDDAVRIRNNEQAKLRRIEHKLDETKNRNEKKQIRKELDRQITSVNKLKKAVTKARDSYKDVQKYNQESRELKSQNYRINKKLATLYEDAIDSKEYSQLSDQKNTNQKLINQRQDKAGKLIYDLNKKLGITPEAIVSKIKFSTSFIKDKLAKDLGEKYIAGLTKKEKEPELEEDLDDGDYVWDNSGIFWSIWRNWDKVESGKVENYDRVTFVMQGETFSFKGTSITKINMKASDMWAIALEMGSDTQITRYRSVDGKKLKYVIE